MMLSVCTCARAPRAAGWRTRRAALRVALLVCALTARCRGDAANTAISLPAPMLLLPPAPAPRRVWAAQLHSLRRQLMRDNYDYQHSADEGQPNITAISGGDTQFYYQQGGTDHLPRASEFAQANVNQFNAESARREHKQRDQLEQRAQHEQGRQYKQPGEYEQRGQYELHDQYEHHRPHKQRGQEREQREHREPNEQRGLHDQRGPHEQRGQNEYSEQQKQFGQFDEQEQAQSIEQRPRAAPTLQHAPLAAPAAVPSTELAVRDVYERDHTPDQAKIHKLSYYNKRREYERSPPAQVQRKPFSDLRGNYEQQYGLNDAGNDMRAHEDLTSNTQESSDQEYATDEQDAFGQQDASGSQDDEGSDFSDGTTRANRLQYYTADRAERNAPSHRVHSSLSYHEHNPPVHRSRNAPPPHRNAPPPHRSAPDHNISKKDLLYYMDDNQLRRRNNEASPDVPNEEQLPSPQPSPGPDDPAGTRSSPSEPARQPARARRSFVVTVSATNVTYKLLTLKSRSGRRQDERRILEERGPAGVAIMSLDHAPLPAFRLPRARRQYMHGPLRHRQHEPA